MFVTCNRKLSFGTLWHFIFWITLAIYVCMFSSLFLALSLFFTRLTTGKGCCSSVCINGQYIKTTSFDRFTFCYKHWNIQTHSFLYYCINSALAFFSFLFFFFFFVYSIFPQQQKFVFVLFLLFLLWFSVLLTAIRFYASCFYMPLDTLKRKINRGICLLKHLHHFVGYKERTQRLWRTPKLMWYCVYFPLIGFCGNFFLKI